MTGFFQRLSRGRPAAGGTERLVLAAFGKHPGWNDHIPGIGVETEALAYVKQTLYVGGIGRQVDSGAWEKLEPDKRLEGFDHVFLWHRANPVLLGELWSSSDRKGRSKYPMVLCVDGENASADLVLERAGGELERLRGICKAVTTAEQVTAECKTAQERLSAPEGSEQPKSGASASVEARRRFLEHPDVGPEQIGLLRVLHELGTVVATRTSGGTIRPCHLRVPAAANPGTESLALWSAFFQAAVPKGTSLLLICRKTANWLDAIIGEPESDSFFCLGASLTALPLTTQIPYDLSPELKAGWEKVKSSFLGESSPKTLAQKPPEPEPALTNRPSEGTVPPSPTGTGPLSLGTGRSEVTPAPRSPAPPAVDETKPPVVPSQKKRGWLLPLVVCAAVLAIAGAAGYWLIMSNRNSHPIAEAKPPPTPSTSSAPAAAAQLKSQTQTQTTAALSLDEQSYQRVFDSAQQAFNQSNFAAAFAQVQAALKIKPNDPTALKLWTDAKAQLDAAAIAANQKQQQYASAMKSAQSALDRQDFSNAVNYANAALSVRANDGAAAKLKATAQAVAAAMEKYNTAMNDAQAAFGKKDYASVIAKVGEALIVRPNDAAATSLKQKAQAALAQAEQDARYGQTMSSAQAAYVAKDYSNAIAQAQAAQAIRPGDAAATTLHNQASQDADLQNAQACLARGELDKAKLLCSAHAGVPAFDALANQIKAQQTDKFDVELEVYLVRFGLLDPRKAKTPEAQRETQWLGELSIQQKDQSLKDVEAIRAAFQAAGKMDATRGKQLDELKASINDHL